MLAAISNRLAASLFIRVCFSPEQRHSQKKIIGGQIVTSLCMTSPAKFLNVIQISLLIYCVATSE